jgi:hypothetical protein
MKKITLREGEYYLSLLLAHSPATAIRYGVLTMLRDAMVCAKPPIPMTDQLVEAARPLCEALDVACIEDVPIALAELHGRPSRKASAAMRNPELAEVVRTALDMLDLRKLANRAGVWGPPDALSARLASPLSGEGLTARGELVSQLRARARELYAEWCAPGDVPFNPVPTIAVDGRSRVAAARAWQVPMITGSIPPVPEASSSRHPNRLGRTAAVVAYSAMPAAVDFQCSAPDPWIFESVALLVAVAEAISEPQRTPGLRRGGIEARVDVRVGAPVGDDQFDVDHWWPVLDAWGSHAPETAKAISTAWRLSPGEADVLVWALCSAAVRLATAAAAPTNQARLRTDPWPAFMAEELPRWEEGAESVWALMQSTRTFEQRVSWPGRVAFSLDDESSWPWQPQPEWGV